MSLEPGELHLGRVLAEGSSQPTGEPLTIPSHALTTHGVIVGMTGSGKTGLGVVLLEEVLSAGIPALILDPKGDMGNLLLTFPSLAPGDFQPWVDEGEARRRGVEAAALARDTADLWKNGLAASGISPEDLVRFRSSVDFRILTPGSSAGLPLNVIGDLSAPELDWEAEGETLRDEIEGLVSGILALAEIEPDPLTSPEHILLSNLVENAWRNGQSLDLATLIGQIPQPPLRKLGVFDLDTFFPPRERMKLAVRLNGLVASPSFAEWIQGEPLTIDSLLRAPDGRPRASVVYLSHLSETEKVFVVTLLLSKMVTWMRRQPGTSELRALVYADEVMGLAPPTAEPPSKRPLLTLFKQARAHGLGLVLATQNPVDMDYKLMSNAGTWMVGRLQTERDKLRIVEAMRSASGEVDVAEWDARVSALGKREFVLKTASSPQPRLFTTRWAMSFLRGPLTRAEIQRLKGEGAFGKAGGAAPAGASAPETPAPPGFPTPVSPTPAPPAGYATASTPPAASPPPVPSSTSAPPPASVASSAAAPPLAPDETPVAPQVASGIRVRYLDPAAPWSREIGAVSRGRRLEAGLAARVRLLFDDTRGDLRHQEEWEAVYFPLVDPLEVESARVVDHDPRDFKDQPPEGAVYALPRVALDKATTFQSLERAIEEHLTRTLTVDLLENATLKLYSRVGESEEDFRRRCLAAAEERADEEAEKLRDRYETRLRTARQRAEDAERRVRELEVDTHQRRQQELVAGAGEVLSMFLGGRRRTRSLAGISSRRSQTVRTQERLRSAEEKLDDHQEAIQEMEEDLAREVQEIWSRWQGTAGEIRPFAVGLERDDVSLEELTLFWVPVE